MTPIAAPTLSHTPMLLQQPALCPPIPPVFPVAAFASGRARAGDTG